MRRLVLTVVALAALGAPAGAAAATKTVVIRATGFKPATLTIRTGDRVTWRNGDKKAHQVVANSGSFASPILRAGKSWTFTFTRAGKFAYHDGLHPSLKGTVVVRVPPPPPAAVSLAASLTVLTFGETTRLAGSVSSGKPNETVAVFARRFDQPSAVQVATVLTGAGGAWAYDAKPAAQTTYQARFRGALSPEVAVYVRPRLQLVRSGTWLYAGVKAATTFAGRFVVLQRRSKLGFWVGVARYRVGRGSGKLIRAPQRRGLSVYRVFLSQSQAGAGYVESWSAARTIRRR